jgi:hypothetical protein
MQPMPMHPQMKYLSPLDTVAIVIVTIASVGSD